MGIMFLMMLMTTMTMVMIALAIACRTTGWAVFLMLVFAYSFSHATLVFSMGSTFVPMERFELYLKYMESPLLPQAFPKVPCWRYPSRRQVRMAEGIDSMNEPCCSAYWGLQPVNGLFVLHGLIYGCIKELSLHVCMHMWLHRCMDAILFPLTAGKPWNSS